MLGTYLARGNSLSTRILQAFAKFDRTKAHVNGTSFPTQWVRSDTLTTARPR
jgi:hypothetical protein